MKEDIKKLEFFLALPFLRFFTHNHIKNKLIQSFIVQDYSINQVLMHQGEDASMVFLIKSGEFEIIRRRRGRKDNLLDDT